jgi:hypothetical protein
VLADHHLHGRLDILEDLLAEFELLGAAELCEISAEQDKVVLWIEGIDIFHCPDGSPDEALI